MTSDYVITLRENASRWKRTTTALPAEAKLPAPYVGKDGRATGPDLPFCLPREYAAWNLLPGIREKALGLFDELGIPWHAGVDGGPTNHLLSSQVQCVNALTAMVEDPRRIVAAFGDTVDIAEVLEIEAGRFLTFEYIGAEDHLDEGRGGVRTRGSHCTSVDAAFRYRTGTGRIELALVEWKFSESYRKTTPDPARDATRSRRYERLYRAADGPLETLVDLPVLFAEPFYQLTRQQLLAHELERHRAQDAERVRVLHVLDPANTDYQGSVHAPRLAELGTTVDDIWARFLRRPSRFRHVHPGVFLDPAVTSPEYVARYGPRR